jgi:hypothetical protein
MSVTGLFFLTSITTVPAHPYQHRRPSAEVSVEKADIFLEILLKHCDAQVPTVHPEGMKSGQVGLRSSFVSYRLLTTRSAA